MLCFCLISSRWSRFADGWFNPCITNLIVRFPCTAAPPPLPFVGHVKRLGLSTCSFPALPHSKPSQVNQSKSCTLTRGTLNAPIQSNILTSHFFHPPPHTDTQPLTLPEYRKMDISKLPLKEQRRYWKLLNRQVIKEKNAAGQKL